MTIYNLRQIGSLVLLLTEMGRVTEYEFDFFFWMNFRIF